MKISNKKGSALVVSFIILSIILISALSLASVSIKERNAAISAGKSNKSFQYADRGIEEVLYKIKKGGATTVSDVVPSGAGCSDWKIVKDDGTYEVSLLDSSDNPINCTSSDPVATISKIKSVGISGGDKRAVEAAVGGVNNSPCDSNEGNSCDVSSCVSGTINCAGTCLGSTSKANGTPCPGGTCNGSGTCVSSCAPNSGEACDNGSWGQVSCPTICITAKVDCGAHVTKHCYPGPITNWTSGSWVQTTNCAASTYTFFLDPPCDSNVFNSIPGTYNCAGNCISN